MSARKSAATLRGDRTAILRPLERGDRDRLVAAFDRLSPESRYRRFFRSMEQMSERELAYLTEIDHHDHEAIIALDPNDDEAAIGVARYVRSPENPGSAEAAVVVADDWHGRGLGKQLLERLSERATEEGIERFTALVQADNHRALDLLSSLGTTTRSYDQGLVELDIELERDRLSPSLSATLRAAAGSAFGTRPLSERLIRKARELYLGTPREIPERYSLHAPIVVGTDGSPGAGKAVARAAELASRLRSPLHVVSAYRDWTGTLRQAALLDLTNPLADELSQQRAAQKIVERAAAQIQRQGLSISAHACEGDPVEALLAVAEDVGAQLIVVGNKGMHSPSRFVLGSVPDKLSHTGAVNVLIEHTSGG